MGGKVRFNMRQILVVVLACGLLIALVTATGGGFPSPSPTPTSGPAPAADTSVPGQSGGQLSGQIHGQVRVRATQLSAHTWRYLYTVHNVGHVPIAGFELNGPRSNLFHIQSRVGWTYYGSGVCGGQHGNVLVYWSTSPGNSLVQPGTSATFGFTVNTTRSIPLSYSLSSGAAQPQFGQASGPAGSTRAAGAQCGT